MGAVIKTLKFTSELADLILSGQKTTSWRLFDDKNLQTGDTIDMVRRPGLAVFARAEITSIVEKRFEDVSSTDMEGHGTSRPNQETYDKFSNMYHRPVNSQTQVKIIKFRLLKPNQ